MCEARGDNGLNILFLPILCEITRELISFFEKLFIFIFWHFLICFEHPGVSRVVPDGLDEPFKDIADKWMGSNNPQLVSQIWQDGFTAFN